MKLTRAQKRVVDALKDGAGLWNPYQGPKMAHVYHPGNSFSVRMSTIHALADAGIIEETDFDEPDVHWKLAGGEQ